MNKLIDLGVASEQTKATSILLQVIDGQVDANNKPLKDPRP